MSPLIDVADLQVDAVTGSVRETAAGRPVCLLDVRWRLDEPEGRPAYLRGHLPGAVYVDLEQELSLRGHPESGRHPLPDTAQLELAVRRWGVHDGDLVVVYDDNDSVAASRAWWLLGQYGIDVRVLDGGFRAWVTAGRPLESGDRVIEPGDAALEPFAEGDVPIEDVGSVPLHGVLVDVRSPEHYRGLRAGSDPQAGHIPGAINIPTVTHIDAAGRFRDPEAIRATLGRFGIIPGSEVAVYCGSGIAAAHSALAYRLAGVEARVYVGSWSQWSQVRGRAVATGSAPYGRIHTV